VGTQWGESAFLVPAALDSYVLEGEGRIARARVPA
jgi:hypothetical protein